MRRLPTRTDHHSPDQCETQPCWGVSARQRAECANHASLSRLQSALRAKSTNIAALERRPLCRRGSLAETTGSPLASTRPARHAVTGSKNKLKAPLASVLAERSPRARKADSEHCRGATRSHAQWRAASRSLRSRASCAASKHLCSRGVKDERDERAEEREVARLCTKAQAGYD